MKKTLIALSAALAASAIPTIASAQLAFNAGVVPDYRYRGISQSRLKPALQGGVDFTQGGLYLGAWGSTLVLPASALAMVPASLIHLIEDAQAPRYRPPCV